ncbi:hypothetical protein chiPu_0017048 [Chiloscyllium punctatum]|uniref:Uncharacterized protein n=1 Tax=Chiloscyllium punctatum TaxID=137246 RepID=A0A401T780_CHIPU|nr:hypothetical protein [Chiloscyllium punctatum]
MLCDGESTLSKTLNTMVPKGRVLTRAGSGAFWMLLCHEPDAVDRRKGIKDWRREYGGSAIAPSEWALEEGHLQMGNSNQISYEDLAASIKAPTLTHSNEIQLIIQARET